MKVSNYLNRKRLKFKKGYTYLNRNMVLDEHPDFIYDRLLRTFKKEDINQYPDLWSTYSALSEYLGVSEDNLLITRGGEGGIKQVFDNFDLKGKSIGITCPGYAMYKVYAMSKGTEVISVKGEYPDCKITVDQIKEIVPKIKILFLDNPKSHLPFCFTHDELFTIIQYCKDHDVIVFIDEVYADWESESYIKNLSKHDNLIISGGFSKIGFPSIKSGWVVTSKNLKKALESNRSSYELNYFACKSVEFLIENQDYINSVKKNLINTKNRWYKELSKSKKFKVYNSKNYVLRLYSDDENLVNTVYENLYKEKIVLGVVDKFNLVFSVVNNR